MNDLQLPLHGGRRARNFDLIVFDWDGTLMDSTALIVRSIQAAAHDLGLEPPADAAAREVIGLGLEQALARALPVLTPDRYGMMAERYRHHYLTHDRQLALFAGTETLIRTLADAGHMLAVATGKSRAGLERGLEVSGLGAVFHGTRCADECFSKPHPQMLEELMDEFGVVPEATLMIGDTAHDLQMARNAGVAAVAISHGAHPREALLTHHPLYCAHSIEDLGSWLRKHA
ncbi:MAG: HAD-IA family hydrolase [Proteobacteria bacterium]|nr:HAD-IA family hydrolase [Pseudomonadota bacterium]HQR03189.1 HAD-IA family hydrolase [Rhodocyclaceae bacterium]